MMTKLILKTSLDFAAGKVKLRTLLLASGSLLVSCLSSGQVQPQFKLLHAFGGGGDGISPSSGVVFDRHGNLFGTTTAGGALGYGIVYELSPQKNGTWAETILHNFPNTKSTTDGSEPSGGVSVDSLGNLYGTTIFGGVNSSGTVYRLSPGDGQWTETILYSFCSLLGCTDGYSPITAPVLDSVGNSYGSSNSSGGGLVYALTPSASGWQESVLYTFCSQPPNCPDGEYPGQVIRDRLGNVYGPTEEGGTGNSGVIFSLDNPDPAIGQWSENVLHDFVGESDGDTPSGVVLEGGFLFGTTIGGGGLCGCGTVFVLKPAADAQGPPQEAILHKFSTFTGGQYPVGAPVFDKAGNMYGTASFGGAPCGCGLVWELKRVAGRWQYEILHIFTGPDGIDPSAGLTMGSDGNLYGTTIGGSTGGVVFEIVLPDVTAKTEVR